MHDLVPVFSCDDSEQYRNSFASWGKVRMPNFRPKNKKIKNQNVSSTVCCEVGRVVTTKTGGFWSKLGCQVTISKGYTLFICLLFIPTYKYNCLHSPALAWWQQFIVIYLEWLRKQTLTIKSDFFCHINYAIRGGTTMYQISDLCKKTCIYFFCVRIFFENSEMLLQNRRQSLKNAFHI